MATAVWAVHPALPGLLQVVKRWPPERPVSKACVPQDMHVCLSAPANPVVPGGLDLAKSPQSGSLGDPKEGGRGSLMSPLEAPYPPEYQRRGVGLGSARHPEAD